MIMNLKSMVVNLFIQIKKYYFSINILFCDRKISMIIFTGNIRLMVPRCKN